MYNAIKNLEMKKKLILLLTVLFITPLFSQEENEKSILTREENTQWNLKFQNENLEGKIQLLKKRFINDQNVYFTMANPHGKTPKKNGYDEITFHRPIYIFKADDLELARLSRNPSKDKTDKINSILIPENVITIGYKDDIFAQAIYGSQATNGIITINFSEKKYLEEIKNIK